MVSTRIYCGNGSTTENAPVSYSMICKIDEGSFSEVFIVRSSDDGKTYALKKILYRGYVDDDPYIPGEISSLSALDHVNVVRLKEVIVGKEEVDIIMEYADGGNLECFLEKSYPLAADIFYNLFLQILSGVEYCHSNSIAHRDLTTSNLLLTHDNVVKLADFGLAMKCSDDAGDSILCDDYLGNILFLPQEVLKQKPFHPKPADVWSLGIVLYCMLTGDVPFKGSQEDVIQAQETRGVLFASSVGVHKSGALCRTKRVIKMLLQTDPLTRPTVNTMLQTWKTYGEYYNGQNVGSPQRCRVMGLHSNSGFGLDTVII